MVVFKFLNLFISLSNLLLFTSEVHVLSGPNFSGKRSLGSIKLFEDDQGKIRRSRNVDPFPGIPCQEIRYFRDLR